MGYPQHCMIHCSTTRQHSWSAVFVLVVLKSDESDDIQTKQDISVNLAAFSSGFDEVVTRTRQQLVGRLGTAICGLQDINVILGTSDHAEPKPPPHCLWPLPPNARDGSGTPSTMNSSKSRLLHFWTLPKAPQRPRFASIFASTTKIVQSFTHGSNLLYAPRAELRQLRRDERETAQGHQRVLLALVRLKKIEQKNASARVPEKKRRRILARRRLRAETDRQTDRQTRCSKVERCNSIPRVIQNTILRSRYIESIRLVTFSLSQKIQKKILKKKHHHHHHHHRR